MMNLNFLLGRSKIKTGGSAKGHNGLKSIINFLGPDFHRLRIGIGRPEHREEVPDYVLEKFKEPVTEVHNVIEHAVASMNSKSCANLMKQYIL